MGRERSGILVHGLFLEDTEILAEEALLPIDREGLLPAGVHHGVYLHLSEPVRLWGTDVERIMDLGDFAIVDEARRSRAWFPVDAFGLFFDAWLAVPMRLKSAARCLRVEGLGDGSVETEEALFGFFTHSVAAIDSFCFALFAAGSMLKPKEFATTKPAHLKQITASHTAELYGKHFQAEKPTKILAGLLGTDEYKELTGIRNVLAHRASPVFSHPRGGTRPVEGTGDDQAERPDLSPAVWLTRGHLGKNVEFTLENLRLLATWEQAVLTDLLVGTEAFVKAQVGYKLLRTGSTAGADRQAPAT